MPIVRITLGTGRSPDQKAALAKDVTEALMRRCGADPANVDILIEDMEPENWLVGTDAMAGPADARDKLDRA